MKTTEAKIKPSGVVYEAAVPIDHTADHVIYDPGQRFSLDHLAPEMVQRLLDQGLVKVVEAPQVNG